jgi:hypothetical protein
MNTNLWQNMIGYSNIPNTEFLLQSELKAIQNGLQYIEEEHKEFTYKGYVDKDGQREGVGIRILLSYG